MIEQLHAAEMQWVEFVQKARGPITDIFFKFLNFFDKQEFIFILVPTLWVGYYWKEGIKLFYLVVLSACINYLLKELFQQPRPFHLDPFVAIVKAGSYGFPSGAAQSSVVLAVFLIQSWKSKWAWFVGANYIFWICLSRVYLGVHFPTDIVGGLFFGTLLACLYFPLYPRVEDFLSRRSIGSCLLLSIAIPLMPLLVNHSLLIVRLAAVSIGVGMGTCISLSYGLFLNYPRNWSEGVIRALWGVGGTFFLYFIMNQLSMGYVVLQTMMTFLLTGLWVSMIAHVLYRKVSDP